MKTPAHTSLKVALYSLILCTAQAAAAEDKEALAHGQELHQESCTQCHSDQVYTRKDRFVKSLEALNKQVRRCKDNANASWFDEDTDAVVNFLNTKYYKF